jgi:DNA-binding LacI/PurR family transcriptional regulator
MPTPSDTGARATLRDVAARAGVSPQTVSNFLNGRTKARAGTRARVERAIRDLNYRPNAAARALRSQQSRTVALLLEDPNALGLHDPLHTEFLHGAAAAAHDAGFYLTVVLTQPGETELAGARIVSERRADGLILSYRGLNPNRQGRIRALVGEGVPVVLLQEQSSLPGVFTVSAEDEAGAAHVVSHFHALGHRRIGLISADPSWPGPVRRRAGFYRTAAELGLETVEWTARAYTIEATRDLLGQHSLGRRRDPTALLAFNDVMALGIVQHAYDIGLSIPEDLSVAGFNDFPFAAWVRPSITTVRLPGPEMGARAVRLLVAAANGGATVEAVTFRVELVVRESTGPAPSRHTRGGRGSG